MIPGEVITKDGDIELNASFPWTWFNRALSKMALGDAKGAEADIRQCLTLNPEPRLETSCRKALEELAR